MDGNRRRRRAENPGPALPRLPFDEGPDTISRRDEVARRHATDPRRNVVLEASAGTGKTTVLVNRYLNLLKAGVDPRNVLAITFTRKAAAEMRQRIVRELQQAASLSAADAARWHDLRDRLGDIAISTIDAFCLSLLREFPLEAGLDPGFDMADDTLVASVKEDALDRALAICRRLAVRHEDVRLLVAQLGEGRLRHGLGRLLDRRLVARGLLRRFTPGAPSSAEEVCRTIADRFAGAMDALPGGLDRFLEDGPRLDRRFQLVAADLRYLSEFAGAGRVRSDRAEALGRTSSSPADRTQPARPVPAGDVARARAAFDGIRHYFLTGRGEPRKRLASGYDRDDFPSPDAFQRHVRGVASLAPPVADLLAAFQGDLNRVLARGVKRAFEIASYQFRRQLEAHAVLDFPELLGRTLALLGRMDEFSQSRYRLEARYHHVLVDEFQDTSRAQWRLVSLLVKSWGEGAGLAGGALPPSIFVVGDRKQSIYGFRDAEATILGRARRDIEALRPQGRVRRSISRSFRSAPALLSFANDLFACVEPGTRADRFRFGRRDTFPVGDVPPGEARLGLIVADGIDACAAGVAAEIARLLGEGAIVRDPRTGAARAATHGDVAILFRSREGHQEYERALAARGIPAYVYKGLGFFDADETKDLLALVDYLGHPDSDVAAAALLRSRLVRISDCALRHLAPGIAAALGQAGEPGEAGRLDAEDARVLAQARRAVATWLPLVDQLTPAEVVDRALDESAYAYELRGPRRVQARENVKKMRALMRRIQNGGYATLADLAGHLRTLSAGDESNAAVDAIDAVNLMTVHAAKGLEFPIVFLVNLSRGTGGGRDPIRVARERGTAWVSIGDFTSDADDQAPERDVEETKRLLYVAVTRARDRLYLSSPLRDGHFAPRRGSLGSVLPASLTALFDREPAASPSIVGWRGPGGRSHEIRVSPAADPAAIAGRGPIAFAAAAVPAPRDAFGHLACDAAPRVAVTMMSSELESAVLQADLAAGFATAEEQPVLGLLVHRLFQYLGHPDVAAAREDLVRRARALTGPPELPVPNEEATTLVERAVEALEAICRDSRIEPLLREGRWLHEVPFSMVQGGLILRGVIDSLVEHADGVTVVEIKTGRTRPEHQRQLDVYRAAAEMLFPGRAIRGVLVYAGHVA